MTDMKKDQVLALEGEARCALNTVLYSYILYEPDHTRCWYVVVGDQHKAGVEHCQKICETILQDHERQNVSGLWNADTPQRCKVLTRKQHDKAIRAILAHNAELQRELDRLRALTPDIDSALRTLDMIREEPGYPEVDLTEIEEKGDT